MKKLLLIAFSFVTLGVQAQVTTKPAVSIGAELGIPSNTVYNIGIGGSAKIEVPIVSALSVSFTAGYNTFFYKNSILGNNVKPDAGTFIPLKAGLKYYLADGFYVEGEAGNIKETNYNKNNIFVFTIGPGFLVPINKSSAVDFGFRYENWHRRLRQTSLRVAYRFAW